MTKRTSTVGRLAFNVQLSLFPTEHGGRKSPIFNDYRPNWDLGNTWLGKPTINDGRVWLDGSLAPGAEGAALLEPLAPEFWNRVRAGLVIPMLEGARLVGHATILGEASRPEHLSQEVLSFVHQARQYCEFIVGAGELPLEARVEEARSYLLDLYGAGRVLPHVEPPDGFDAGPSPAEPTNWQGFERFEFYWEVFDPYVDEPPGAGSISNDLLDVYRDVQRGLGLWDSDAPREAAIWEWRFHFDVYWGDDAIDALRALHWACRA